MADTVSAPVRKCVEILNAAESDTEKFAALFMVTKLVKAKECTTASKRALFEAIGFNFLRRLLESDNVPDDCPPIMYKSVALSILTCFCEDEQVATHPTMLENLPVFLAIVENADDEDFDDNLMVVSESYKCLQGIASFEPGQQALLDLGAIEKMAQIYSQQSFITDEALHILVTLISRFGPKAWGNDPKTFNGLIQKIALDFETDHGERKFELAGILYALFHGCRREIVARTCVDYIWPESLYKGLTDILKSKIGKQQREPALKLAAAVVDVIGIEWTLNDADNPKQFFILLLQLAAIEVRMQMDNKSFSQAFSNAELIIACFIILELSINFMSTDQLDLEQKEKQQIYTGLKGAFNGVTSVLTKLSKDKNCEKLPVKEKAFACACIRVLAAWMAQEPSILKADIFALLPFMFKMANDSFIESRDFRIKHKYDKEYPGEAPADLLRVLLPSMCHLVVEETSRNIFLKLKEEEVLSDCLLFHWTIAHYKKPPVPRAERLKRMNEPPPELTPEQLDEMKDSRAAIVSLCNIFMNITVLEPKLVDESDCFANLLRFIFNNLPELKNTSDNLVMYGHLAILGLLMLKQRSTKVEHDDYSICRYMSSTIRFLWDAYTVDESNDPTALNVSMAYREHWSEIQELWFLGMQTMCAVIKLIPWISEFAIESGWAEGIIETLKRVRIGALPPNIKPVYEDFLSELVDANKDVAAVLKKADALKVCRNHRMMELGKKLFGD
uniref:CSON002570 protein n=1 Tax=Culicoides sonorensis TaxID=179676 RepID=A0A336MNV8_CULSO